MSRSVPPSELPEGDYFAVEAAVKETPLGRWFLEEYARRNRTDEAASALDALSRLSEMPGGGGADNDRLNKILDLVVEARRQPTSARPGKTAEAALAAIRTHVDKIREVAYELRESGRMDIYAGALELYCTDLLSAFDAQEAAVTRLGDLSKFLATIESTISEMVGREPGEEPAAAEPAVEAPKPALARPDPVGASLVRSDEDEPVESRIDIVRPPVQPAPPSTAPATMPERKLAASAGIADATPAPKAQPAKLENAVSRQSGVTSSMPEAQTSTPKEPAAFVPTPPPSSKDGSNESNSAKLVREARALFFVNPS